MKVRSGHAAAYQLLAGPRATRGPARAAGAVTALALTADEASLAAAAADGAVCIVRVGAASLEPLALLPGLGAPGRALACWSPDAARLLVAGPGGEAAEVARPRRAPPAATRAWSSRWRRGACASAARRPRRGARCGARRARARAHDAARPQGARRTALARRAAPRGRRRSCGSSTPQARAAHCPSRCHREETPCCEPRARAGPALDVVVGDARGYAAHCVSETGGHGASGLAPPGALQDARMLQRCSTPDARRDIWLSADANGAAAAALAGAGARPAASAALRGDAAAG